MLMLTIPKQAKTVERHYTKTMIAAIKRYQKEYSKQLAHGARSQFWLDVVELHNKYWIHDNSSIIGLNHDPRTTKSAMVLDIEQDTSIKHKYSVSVVVDKNSIISQPNKNYKPITNEMLLALKSAKVDKIECVYFDQTVWGYNPKYLLTIIEILGLKNLSYCLPYKDKADKGKIILRQGNRDDVQYAMLMAIKTLSQTENARTLHNAQ